MLNYLEQLGPNTFHPNFIETNVVHHAFSKGYVCSASKLLSDLCVVAIHHRYLTKIDMACVICLLKASDNTDDNSNTPKRDQSWNQR